MAISVWIKTRRLDKSPPAVIAKGDNTWRLQFTGDKYNLTFSLTGPQTTDTTKGRAPSVTSKQSLADGRWHHAAAFYDGQRVALYVDGQLEDAVAASGFIAQNTEPVIIGANPAGRGSPFDGWIDDLRLYDRHLSENEVQALYRGTAGPVAGAK
jgi:hypothetical protein